VACVPKERGANELTIGTITGPETELMQAAKKVAEQKFHLHIKIVEFEDYITPNLALAEKSIDANMFQHKPYLDAMVQERSFDQLVTLCKTFIYPMGIYSKKLANLEDLPIQSTVGIPIDPSNGARALLLLEKAKLITLKTHDVAHLTKADILENPKQLSFHEMDAALLPRSLADLTLAVLNTNYAIPAHLIPNKDALLLEDKDSPYANLVVIRKEDLNKPKYHQLMEALHSPEVLHEAEVLFQGQAVQAW
jgi:D-methionine transport system substrate-binding protein